MKHATSVLGLRKNWRQFSLLLLVNACVGGVLGMERSILPSMASAIFGLESQSFFLSFILVFGLVKAISNYYAGALANRWGRKRLLLLGWAFAFPVPLLLMFAPSWHWVVLANVFLGLHQGLAWSSTVIMKMDLVGDRHRGLAMGLNECTGYLTVALTAYFTAYIAQWYGLRPYPFFIGLGLIVLGLLITWIWVEDTQSFMKSEEKRSPIPRLVNVFWESTWRHPSLGSVTIAGLINNLNDGMLWGLLPLVLAQQGFDLVFIGFVVALYPGVWGMAQLFTGPLSDMYPKKSLLVSGMTLQALAIFALLLAKASWNYYLISIAMGLGTALVYPTFLASIASNTHALDRAKALGVFRFWRDLGYALGALMTAWIGDVWGISSSIAWVGSLTLGAGIMLFLRMPANDAPSTIAGNKI